MIRGKLTRAQGALGGFTVGIDALQQVVPGGRGSFALTDGDFGSGQIQSNKLKGLVLDDSKAKFKGSWGSSNGLQPQSSS